MTKPCKVEQSPGKLILIQGQLGFSPAVLKKVILSTEAPAAGQQWGTAELSRQGPLLPAPPLHLVLWDFWPPFLTHPSGNTAKGCWETFPKELPTCRTVSSEVEIKPIPNPLTIQIVINNFSPWKQHTLTGTELCQMVQAHTESWNKEATAQKLRDKRKSKDASQAFNQRTCWQMKYMVFNPLTSIGVPWAEQQYHTEN